MKNLSHVKKLTNEMIDSRFCVIYNCIKIFNGQSINIAVKNSMNS